MTISNDTAVRMQALIKKNGGPTALGRGVDPNIISDQLSAGMILNYQAQVIQWEAQSEDVTAWTVTLGEFVTSGIGGIPTAPGYSKGAAPTINPTTGGLVPANGVIPISDVVVMAEVSWGAGGVTHVALVDWPCRGGSFTVNGNFVRVKPVGDFATLGTPQVPRLQATIGPATGQRGTMPATRTYVPQVIAALGQLRIVVPAFARRAWPQLVGGVTAQFRFTFQAENLSNLAQYEFLNNANQSTNTRATAVPVPPRAMYLLINNVDAAVVCTVSALFELDL